MDKLRMLGVGLTVLMVVMMGFLAFSIGSVYGEQVIVENSRAIKGTDYQSALDTTLTGWTSSGNAQWVVTTTGAYYGGSCAKSGKISHNQQSKLSVTVTGPGTLSFYWNVSSELNYDFLKFYIDGVEKARISGTSQVWHQRTYSIPSGTHTLTWNYTKDGSVNKGSDCGWLDKVTYTSGGTTITIGEAVDNTQLTWTTGGNAEWFGQSSTYYNGGDAAQSGIINHNQVSYVQTTVTGPGTLSFYWKVSSEANYDFLIFYIDGVEQVKISGEKGWEQKTFSITSGTHTLQWKYSKDGSVSSGSDCGWLDKVEFTSGGGGGGGGGTGTVRYAVLVGISDYKAISDLSYCDEDVNSWYDYLTSKGYSSSNIILLGDKTSSYRKYDGVATETNVKNALNTIISQADEDDILVFVTSGHGDKSSSTSHFLCMWDCAAGENGNDGYLYDTELANIIKNARCRVFLFHDNCRSGGIIPEISALPNANKIYMTTTCGPNGYGYDVPSYQHGAWTYWFLVSGLMNKGYTYMEDCFAYADGQYNPGGDDEPRQFDGDSSTKFSL